MATIGLYDIDFHHGLGFTLSLPLMKAYARLMDEGHQVIMMKPYEKTGRYNKIFYFKDSIALPIPKKLIIDQNKGVFCGRAFFGETGINEKTNSYTPSFLPYDLFKDKIRDKVLYGSVKKNSLIDWRMKDFSLSKADAHFTYINDRDFTLEDDWREMFQHFDNKIRFLHTVKCNSKEDAKEFERLATNIYQSRIMIPFDLDKEMIETFAGKGSYRFDNTNVSEERLCTFILAAKTLTDKPIHFYRQGETQLQKDLLSWATKGQISFKEFKGDSFNESNYITFPKRLLLKQNPKTISYEELVLSY